MVPQLQLLLLMIEVQLLLTLQLQRQLLASAAAATRGKFGTTFVAAAVADGSCATMHTFIKDSTADCTWRVIQFCSSLSLELVSSNGTLQKKHRELDDRSSFEIGNMALQMQ